MAKSERSDVLHIPRVIHQTWKHNNLENIKDKTFREVAMRSQRSWKANHQHYEYMFWTDHDMESFVKNQYAWFYPTWKGFNVHIKRVDTARYCWLHYYGGMYADLDFICLKPMDPVLKGKEVVLYKPEKHKESVFAGNAWMASIPGHPLWLGMLHYTKEYACPEVRDVTGVMDHTGPFGLGKVVERYALSQPDHMICLLQSDEIGNNSTCKYAYHTREGTWVPQQFFSKIKCLVLRNFLKPS
ncbi:MAG: glycosyltransferase [Pseudomonadota bacterium]